MSSVTYLVGIDIGGTAVKVGLFDLGGVLQALHSQPIAVSTPRPGWAEIDPPTVPVNDGDFTIHVHRVIELFRCEKVRGKTQCNDSVGFIAVEDLNYLILD